VNALVRRLGLSDRLWVALLAVACVADGVLAGYDSTYGLLAAVGGIFAVLVIADLTLGFAFFTALVFLDVINASSSASGTKLVGLILFASWLARVANGRWSLLREFISENGWLVVSLVAFLGWATMSFTWAASAGTALGGAGRLALNIAVLPIGFAAVRERRHLLWVFAAFVLAATFSAAYGIASGGASVRDVGTIGDPNAQATMAAAAIPLAAILIGELRRSPLARLAAIAALAILLVGVVDSASREGIVGLGTLMASAVVFGGRWRGRFAAMLALGAVLVAGYVFVLAPLATRQRLTMSSTSGRTTLWLVAWRVARANPLLGVGQGNFIIVEDRYLNRPGSINALYVIQTPKVVHNTYLEELADLGVLGLIAYLGILASCLGAAVRAAWIFERLGDRRLELMARALFFSQVGIIAAHFFVSGEYEKYQYVLLALCPAVLSMARRAQRAARPVTAVDRRGSQSAGVAGALTAGGAHQHPVMPV
jgi:putative inorganic carbon (HCO3(-)) transporter